MYFSVLCREVEREGSRECTSLYYVEKWKGKGLGKCTSLYYVEKWNRKKVGNVLLCIM